MRDGKVVAGDRPRNSTVEARSPRWAESQANPRRDEGRFSRRARRGADPRANAREAPDGRTGARRAARARSSASPASPAMARPIFCSPPLTPPRRPRASETVAGPVALVAGRPRVGRHLPALVDRREHRRPLAEASARRGRSSRPARGRAGRGLARADRHPHAGRRQQHPVALRRQPAEGAVRPRARLRRRDRPDGRPDARRRLSAPSSRSTSSSARRRQGGRTFLWYTTETEELEHCDHVYVFRNGRIVADLSRDELTEERVIHSSFAGGAS